MRILRCTDGRQCLLSGLQGCTHSRGGGETGAVRAAGPVRVLRQAGGQNPVPGLPGKTQGSNQRPMTAVPRAGDYYPGGDYYLSLRCVHRPRPGDKNKEAMTWTGSYWHA